MKHTIILLALACSVSGPVYAQPQCMEGMQMPGCPAPSKPSTANPMQGMHADTPDTIAPPHASVTHATLTLQEPEDPARRTGTLRSAVPELLTEVRQRPAMTLYSFLAMAGRANPTLAEANAIVRRSAQQARQAGLYPNPSIGYQGEQIRGGSYGGGEQGGYVEQTIVLGGKLGRRRNIYEQQKTADEIGVREQTLRVRSDVTQAFYAALTSQGLVDVRRHLLQIALDAAETAHQLANVGQADAPDILQAEVEAEQAKVEYARAQRRYIESFRVLAADAGSLDLVVTPLQGSLDDPPQMDAEQQVARIVAESPTVKRSQQEVAIAEARLRAVQREVVPDLTVRVGEQYNGERVAENPAKPAGAQSFASAGISIPLWNRNQGSTEAAKAELERSRQDVLRTQLLVKQQAEPLAQAYLSARFEAVRYKTELIPRAQRAYELYLQKYQSMAAAYPQVLVSQRTLFQLQVGYLQALHEVWSNAVALQDFTLSGALAGGSMSASGVMTNSSASFSSLE